MIDVCELYGLIKELASKSNTTLSPEEFNTILTSVECELLSQFLNTKEWSEYEITALARHSTRETITLIDGKADIPEDWAGSGDMMFRDSTNTDDKWVPVNYMRIHEISETCTSAIRNPSIKDCRIYYTFIGGRIEIFPSEVESVDYVYYKYPTAGSIKATQVGNEQDGFDIQIDKEGSTDLQWEKRFQGVIIRMVLQRLGVSNQDTDILSGSGAFGLDKVA